MQGIAGVGVHTIARFGVTYPYKVLELLRDPSVTSPCSSSPLQLRIQLGGVALLRGAACSEQSAGSGGNPGSDITKT